MEEQGRPSFKNAAHISKPTTKDSSQRECDVTCVGRHMWLCKVYRDGAQPQRSRQKMVMGKKLGFKSCSMVDDMKKKVYKMRDYRKKNYVLKPEK